MEVFLAFTVVGGLFFLVFLFCYIIFHAEKWMPIPSSKWSDIKNISGPMQLHVTKQGVPGLVQVCSTGVNTNLKVQMSETLLVYRTYEASQRSLIGRWINAEKCTFGTAMTGYRFNEVVIMPYLTDSKVEQSMIDEWISDHASTLLTPGGKLIDMNNPVGDDVKENPEMSALQAAPPSKG